MSPTDQPAPPSWCPRCLTVTDLGVCPTCALPQAGATVAELRVVVYRMTEVQRARGELVREEADLAARRQVLLAALEKPAIAAREAAAPAGFDTFSAAPAGAPRGELRAEVVRDVLLWVGGLLLALAALIFAAFAWRRLDDGGRALLLLGATFVSGGIAAWLRARLTATAEVFAALTTALLAVDWLALRIAGAGDGLDLPTWWAIGSGAIAVAGLVSGALYASTRVLMVVAATASAYLAVFAATGTEASTSIAFSLLALGGVTATAAAARAEWQPSAVLLGASSVAFVASAAIAALVAVLDAGEPSLLFALAVGMCGLAPAAAATLATAATRDLLVGVSTVGGLAGAAVGWWTEIDAPWLAAAVAATAALVLGVAAFAPKAARAGAMWGASAVLATVTAGLIELMTLAMVGPFTFADEAWDHDVMDHGRRALASVTGVAIDAMEARAGLTVVLLVAAGLVVVSWRRGGRSTSPGIPTIALASFGSVIATTVAIAMTPLAFDLSVGGAAGIMTAVASAAMLAVAIIVRARPTSEHSLTMALAAGALALPAAGWALASEPMTLAACAAALASALSAGALLRSESTLRRAFFAVGAGAFAALVGTGALAADATGHQVGIAVAAASAVLFVVAVSHADGIFVEPVAAAVAVAGVALAWDGDVDRAVAFTVLVPGLAAPGVRPDRRAYLGAAAIVAVFATWAWLVVADVRLVEAYTLPAAAGALVAGELHRRSRTGTRSWTAYGPALAIAFGPTLAVALDETGLVRPAMLAVVAVAIVAVGARSRLQAPLVVGSVTLAALAVDTLGPVAAQLPRWLTVGLAGALLVWLGTTADRRLVQLREARRRFEQLEHPSM